MNLKFALYLEAIKGKNLQISIRSLARGIIGEANDSFDAPRRAARSRKQI